MNKITFFTCFEQDIVAGRKTITIRDKSESYFQSNQILDVYTNETDRFFTKIKVLSVTPIHFNELSEQHARQENMTLPELRQVIKAIYPDEDHFWVILFELVQS